MYDGSIEATTSSTQIGTASVTSPAPLRNAAWPASEIAPLIPRDPPTKSARPKSPLWLSASRVRSEGNGVLVISLSFTCGITPASADQLAADATRLDYYGSR